jgi:hypothetical protein
MNVILQIDRRWPGYPERYRIRKGDSEFCGVSRPHKNGNRQKNNSGDPEVFKDFLDWAQSGENEAEHYLLVLWGHAYGLGFGRDHGDALTLPEMARALNGRNIDILGSNACAMSYAEAAFELRNGPQFLVASEIAMPFAGWPYEEILTEIVKKPDIEPKTLGEGIVKHFKKSLGRQSVALTLLDLGHAGKLGNHIKDLAGALDSAVRRNGTGNEIAEAFLDTAHGEVRPLIDLFDLCNNLINVGNKRIRNVGDERIRDAAKALREFLKVGAESFVVKHETGPNLEGLHGVGIFALSVTGAADLMRLELSGPKYKKLKLTKNNAWAKLVFKKLKDLLEPVNKEVAEFVKGTGATGLEERTGVAQLLMGVHRSFVKLERSLETAQEKATSALNGAGHKPGEVLRQALGTPPIPTEGQRLATAVRLSPPYLRLAEELSLQQQQHVEAALAAPLPGSAQTAGNGGVQSAAGPLEPVAESLADLEEALANVERTTKRVLTHSTLGLGPGDLKSGLGPGDLKSGLGPGDLKSGLGPGDLKSGLGPGDLKSGLGPGDLKSGLGNLPWLIAQNVNGASASDATRDVAELYGQVAWSLQVSEGALAKLENVVRAVLTGPMYDLNSEDNEYRERAAEQVEQSFRAMAEMVANARQTAGLVLAHPTYGLGPGLQSGLGTQDRELLAVAGGLSPRLLQLL